ncbi:MAG: MATE family efflux transporter [Eubacteriales bacterium]|nr:MATE family efflux transporter [Eubacteriales bacterium]
MKNLKEKYIASKEFYIYVLGMIIPMVTQNLITNFVSMIDNIMVGKVGTLPMSGVSIVNQFIFVFNITIFGAMSGASIFGTQFFGKKDTKGQRYTVRYRLIMAVLVILAGMLILKTFGPELIGLFLSKKDSPEKIASTLAYGMEYLNIIIWSLIPFAIGQAYSSVVRECGKMKICMYASMGAIVINLFLDYTLIFGKCGFPEMGVAGAAIATVIAKSVEALIVISWVHRHPAENPYIIGIFHHFFHIPASLIRRIVIKSFPLLLNEFLWALGMAMVSQCYSVKGIDVVAARNIAVTITNLFSAVYVQMGSVIGIIIGARLGAGHFEEARDCANKLIVFAVFVSTLTAIALVPVGIVFPMAYKTEAAIRSLATFYIIVQAITMPMESYANAAYFTLRSGGKIGITFLFDSGFTWVILIPFAYALTHFVNMDIHWILCLVTFTILLKCFVGHFMVKSDIWVNNIVNEE